MRLSIVFLLLGAALAPLAGGQGNGTEVVRPLARDEAALVEQLRGIQGSIRGDRIYQCIDEITKGVPTQYRVMGTPTHELFLEKYKTVFTAISPRFKSHVQHFDGKGPPGVSATPLSGGDNLIAALPGRNVSQWIVLGGHYDTREATLGGAAIDNTSGMCTVLEIARAVDAAKVEFEATLVFAWWDGEEWGLYGSTHFVENHASTKQMLGLAADSKVEILAAMSFDIVGINYPAKNTWVGYGAQTLDELALLNLRVAPTVAENLTRIYPRVAEKYEQVQPRFVNYSALVREIAHKLLGMPWQWADLRDDEYGRSDHVPFIRAGVPGMRIQGSHDCDTNNGCEWPHYHQASDTLETAAQQAGGKDLLEKGFESAAESGGLTAAYVALKGGVGDYGVPEPQEAPRSIETTAAAASGIPAPAAIILLVALALGALIAARPLRR